MGWDIYRRIVILMMFGVMGALAAHDSSTGDTSNIPTATGIGNSQNTPSNVGSTTATPTTQNDNSALGNSLNDTVHHSCRGDQSGTYPNCYNAAPIINCNGMDLGSYYSYNCSDAQDSIYCSGTIIGTIASNNCDTQKGGPYTCINDSISSMVSITCTGVQYIDNSSY